MPPPETHVPSGAHRFSPSIFAFSERIVHFFIMGYNTFARGSGTCSTKMTSFSLYRPNLTFFPLQLFMSIYKRTHE